MDVSPLSVDKARGRCTARTRFAGRIWTIVTVIFSAEQDGIASTKPYASSALEGRQCARSYAVATPSSLRFRVRRNLLIYFDQPTQQQVFEVLKRLTHVDGVLFIGPAEGSLLGRLGMRSIGIAQSFAFSRHSDPQPEPLPVARPVALPVSQPIRSTPPPPVRNRPFAAVTPLPVTRKSANPDAATLLANIAALANEGKSVRPAPRAINTCAATNPWRRCSIGLACSAMSPA